MTETPGPLLGCIADDHTGGADVAAGIRRAGLRTALLFGVPHHDQDLLDCDAVVVALKTRTVPLAEAVAESLAVRRWLRSRWVQHVYVKYCSTFDSTDRGNIGGVVDALLDDGEGRTSIVCPSSPEHGRTTYQGHLFVGTTPLSESHMRHHPLTPMTDSDLVRVLARQTSHGVGLVPLHTVRQGPAAVRVRLIELEQMGIRHVVVDATEQADLEVLARAKSSGALLTGGAGLASTFAAAHAPSVAAACVRDQVDELPPGPGLVLAGSCSEASLEQVRQARRAFPSFCLDPAARPDPAALLDAATTWLRAKLGSGPLLIYSTASADDRAAGLAAMGPKTADVLERTLGALAVAAVAAGVRRIVVAGGETSGAVTSALGVRAVEVAGEADPGVPWCLARHDSGARLALLLKSGNFGRPDLLVRSMEGASA